MIKRTCDYGKLSKAPEGRQVRCSTKKGELLAVSRLGVYDSA
jgi:hypothetical protein